MNRYLKSIGIGFFLLYTFHFAGIAQNEIKAIASFEVEPGKYDRLNSPVGVNVSSLGLAHDVSQYKLIEITDGTSATTPFQLERSGQADMLWWVLEGTTKVGKKRRFQLRKGEALHDNKINLSDGRNAILFKQGNKNILQYQYGLATLPEGVPEIYSRGGFIHPIHSPKGGVLTRIQPPDHYHHYGLWNPWTHTEYDGKEVDFWNLNKGQGTVVVKNRPIYDDGNVFGQLTVLHQHVVKDKENPDVETPALNEILTLRVWNLDKQQKIWVIDFNSTLSCADSLAFTIKKYRYQGFGFRATENWHDDNAKLLTSEGKNKSDANGTRARWCLVEGPTAVGTAGIVFMNHQANFNSPQQLRIWPEGMNEGKENVFVNFNPAQDRDWELLPGSRYELKYRMIVYDDELGNDEIESFWNDYAHPPNVTMTY